MGANVKDFALIHPINFAGQGMTSGLPVGWKAEFENAGSASFPVPAIVLRKSGNDSIFIPLTNVACFVIA
jgi:hypothetical protein